MLGIQAFT